MENHYSQSASNEWYTPARYADAVRETFGGAIDLDPASNEFANRVIRAERIYTINDDGLAQPWAARSVFVNPPYGKIGNKSSQAVWSKYLLDQFRGGAFPHAILLVNACTSEKWFQPLWDHTLCFTDHRIKFYKVDQSNDGPTKGNVFVYLGADYSEFKRVFVRHGIGNVVRRA